MAAAATSSLWIGELLDGKELSTLAFFLHSDLDQILDTRDITVCPACFASLTDVVAADVLDVFEDRSSLLHRFPPHRLE